MLVFQVVTFGVFLSYLFMSGIDVYILDDIPVVLTLLLIGIWFALIPLFSEGQRQYYFIIGAAIIAAALLPATGLMTKAQVIGVENSGAHVVFSLGWVLGGLLDHWLLVRLFHELQETNYETAV